MLFEKFEQEIVVSRIYALNNIIVKIVCYIISIQAYVCDGLSRVFLHFYMILQYEATHGYGVALFRKCFSTSGMRLMLW